MRDLWRKAPATMSKQPIRGAREPSPRSSVLLLKLAKLEGVRVVNALFSMVDRLRTTDLTALRTSRKQRPVPPCFHHPCPGHDHKAVSACCLFFPARATLYVFPHQLHMSFRGSACLGAFPTFTAFQSRSGSLFFSILKRAAMAFKSGLLPWRPRARRMLDMHHRAAAAWLGKCALQTVDSDNVDVFSSVEGVPLAVTAVVGIAAASSSHSHPQNPGATFVLSSSPTFCESMHSWIRSAHDPLKPLAK